MAETTIRNEPSVLLYNHHTSTFCPHVCMHQHTSAFISTGQNCSAPSFFGDPYKSTLLAARSRWDTASSLQCCHVASTSDITQHPLASIPRPCNTDTDHAWCRTDVNAAKVHKQVRTLGSKNFTGGVNGYHFTGNMKKSLHLYIQLRDAPFSPWLSGTRRLEVLHCLQSFRHYLPSDKASHSRSDVSSATLLRTSDLKGFVHRPLVLFITYSITHPCILLGKP